MDLTRRTFVDTTTAILVNTGIAATTRLLSPTPAEVTGPFYPVTKPLDHDADLTRIVGTSGRAKGQVIELKGQLINRLGQPVKRAQIELWQANAAGRYRHASDDTGAPLDPHFDGYARILSDDKGMFRFITIKPGGYDGGRRGYRTPHLHFDVTGHVNRMVTQMYFPDEPRTNATDQLLNACIDAPAVTATAMPMREDGIARYTWSFILRDG
jgi:protocatechuate 3,4-dioxygenase, beta subunit